MQAVRQAMNVVGDVAGTMPHVVEGTGDRRRRGRVRAQLVDLDHQNAQQLADMVVELATDAASLLFLGMNESPGQLFERQFGLFALGDVPVGFEDETAILSIANQHLAAFDDQLTAVTCRVRQFAIPLSITL
jgi:hypothetical protein